MTDRIKLYVDTLFADAPRTKKAYDLKEEVCANLIEKYRDLTAGGMAEAEAFNTVIAGIGDVEELFADLKDNSVSMPEDPRSRRRNALCISVAVSLYIVSLIPLFLSDFLGYAPELGLVFMFALCALATGLLIFNALNKPRYHKLDDTMVEEFKEWKAQQGSRENGLQNAIISAFWMLIVAVYFIVSFVFSIWAYSWLLFLIGAALAQVIRALFALKNG